MVRYIFTLLSLFTVLFRLDSQPKHEMRAVWIAHVNNIDFPSASNLTETQQKQQFKEILNNLKKNNINAVVVQIRTNCDASYPSDIEPWSAFWTGTQGVGPGYDPLNFMIEECHKNNLEFHAWFNPYRAAPSILSFAAENHVRKLHPEWIVEYNGLQILDPSLPEVRNHINNVVLDVVRRYDIDAVHFDDYFYPYPVAGAVFNDEISFLYHNRGFTNKADWRRDNVNLLVKSISTNIKALKPWVKFGIAPFGIWKNLSSSQPDGSNTRGLEAFHSIFAVSRKWLQEGWLDYIAPQVYWSIGFSIANYSVLAPWWADNIKNPNTHLYMGHAAYKINNGGSDLNWLQPTQIPDQINFQRNINQIKGSCFYNTTSFLKNMLGLNDSLQQNQYKNKAIIPAMKWIDSIPPPAPANFSAQKLINGVQLSWHTSDISQNEMQRVKYYGIYRFEDGENINVENSKNLIDLIAHPANSYLDVKTVDKIAKYTYVLTAFDRLNNESGQSFAATIHLTNVYDFAQNQVQLYSPVPNPFSDMLLIEFQLPVEEKISIDIYNLAGIKIINIFEGKKAEGIHREYFDGTSLAPGIYLVSLRTSKSRLIKKVIRQ